MNTITITIDNKKYNAKSGQTICEAAAANKVYIPTLCHHPSLKPAGACRICSVRIAGKIVSACTTPVSDKMVIENEVPEIIKLRKTIIELLFIEGNHMCPMCQKSGDCVLQALAYKYQIMDPEYPFLYPEKDVDSYEDFIIDHNRCVKCTRCVRAFKKDKKNVFGLIKRGFEAKIVADQKLNKKMNTKEVEAAMQLCPVGSILKKEIAYKTPIGKRKFDINPIGLNNE